MLKVFNSFVLVIGYITLFVAIFGSDDEVVVSVDRHRYVPPVEAEPPVPMDQKPNKSSI